MVVIQKDSYHIKATREVHGPRPGHEEDETWRCIW